VGNRKIKILFLNADTGDYLNISLLNGLRSLDNVEVVDFPKSDVSYKTEQPFLQSKIRGKGFTLFFTLDDTPINRFHLKYNEVINDAFDLIIFGDIQASFGLYLELLPYLKPNKTCFLDGSDAPNLFGDAGFWWRRWYYWTIPKPQNRFLYFKREWIPEEVNVSRFYKILPRFLCRLLPQPKNLRKISFSIPLSKIVNSLPQKSKLFTRHIVDEEVAKRVEGSATSYAFENEEHYYQDIQASKFGITTKRSGWDCLRHYEIAANGAVMCFKDLDKKPIECAPHGLIDGINCISYHNYADLTGKIKKIDDAAYTQLVNASIEWARDNSSKKVALRLLEHFFSNLSETT
jgi:hypothetical protein